MMRNWAEKKEEIKDKELSAEYPFLKQEEKLIQK